MFLNLCVTTTNLHFIARGLSPYRLDRWGLSTGGCVKQVPHVKHTLRQDDNASLRLSDGFECPVQGLFSTYLRISVVLSRCRLIETAYLYDFREYSRLEFKNCRSWPTETCKTRPKSQKIDRQLLKSVFKIMFLITIFLDGLEFALFAVRPFQWHDIKKKGKRFVNRIQS